jgi:pseudouridine synthase
MEERLQKVLARAGVASRREAERLILEGRVAVNGHVVRELGVKIDPALDEVAVDTVPLPRDAAAGAGPRTYLLLNKPKGVVCTAKDTHGRPTVLDLVPPRPGKRLYPVGRLDEDSEGLVLLTDDGDLTARLTHPRFGVPKTYDVRVKGFLRPDDARTFERGVWLSEGKTGPSRLRIRRSGRDVSHVAVTLTEGRNREIRRAFAKLGFPVLTVRRVSIGPIRSRGLPVGAFRPLHPEELEELRETAAGRPSTRPFRPRRDDGAPRPRRRPGKPDPALSRDERSDGGPARGPDRGPGRGSRGKPDGRPRRPSDRRPSDRRPSDRHPSDRRPDHRPGRPSDRRPGQRGGDRPDRRGGPGFRGPGPPGRRRRP